MAQSSLSTSHKARKRRKDFGDQNRLQNKNVTRNFALLSSLRTPPFPLASFLWPARSGLSQWVLLPLVLMFVGLYRWAAGFWGYSGFQSPPMHGDFEAQRHWMEVTTQLPVSQWYFHDLDWWGLDYPPLTAYHSWLLGKTGAFFNPSWFALYTSRGLDDPSLKVYMRATVIVSEYAIYVPAVVLFCRKYARLQNINSWEASVALVAILLQPAIILVDHAHFQYNTVMLGFVIACITSLLSQKLLWGCVFFVGALGFKQMALYYAPVIFAYLLGSCVFPQINLTRFLGIATITAVSFVVLFSPLLLGAIIDARYKSTLDPISLPPMVRDLKIDTDSFLYLIIAQLAQAIHRVFPFARGLFEDKVANFWCALHSFHKLHQYPIPLLQKISLGATVVAIIPPCITVFLYPQRTLLPHALAASAWGFFLFSFQVHEKSVLLPLLPMTLLLAGDGGLQPTTRAWITWINLLSSWTLFPLLKRDQLRVPYFVLTLLWGWLMGMPSLLVKPLQDAQSESIDRMTRMFHGSFYVTMFIWHFLEAFVPAPLGKPDIWVVVNVLIGAAGFGTCYLWCLWRLWNALPSSFDPQSKGKRKMQ